MNHRDRIKFNREKLNLKITDEQAVERLVNILIDALYIPVHGFESITRVDPDRLNHFGIDDKHEAINWGDLKCNEIKVFDDGSFLVIIDEAAPDNCGTFCEYIRRFMQSYGWEVEVKTEW